ncbi:RluA family pseudouridine synthase [Candidatus Peregrinibacteria bacterium]|nr:RluA family pseudouridine synthase [Candidatus Peregrinibacteria bacterium]
MSKKTTLQIIYEDSYILAVNKPPRIAVVPAKDIPLPETVLGKIQNQFKGRSFKPYILHRLDYETSGVLLFGKFEKNRKMLEGIFQHPDIQKKYIALVKGTLHSGTISLELKARKGGAKIPAQTNFKILKIFRPAEAGPVFSLIEAEIKTGRKHQIRQHFALIGHPVILDSKYGDQRLNRAFRLNMRLGRLFLHAAEINFYHPFLKKEMKITVDLPPDLQSVLKKLNFAR